MLLNFKGNSPSVPEEVPKFVKTRVLDDIIAIPVEEKEHVTSYCTWKAQSFSCTINSTSSHIEANFSTEP